MYACIFVCRNISYLAGIFNHGEILKRMNFTNITEMQTHACMSLAYVSVYPGHVILKMRIITFIVNINFTNVCADL